MVAQSIYKEPTGWRPEFRFLVRKRYFSVLHSVQSSSQGDPAFYLMGRGPLPRGVKRLGREADHSLASSAEVRNGGAVPPTLHVFMAW
jgi:hypothetical protein